MSTDIGITKDGLLAIGDGWLVNPDHIAEVRAEFGTVEFFLSRGQWYRLNECTLGNFLEHWAEAKKRWSGRRDG